MLAFITADGTQLTAGSTCTIDGRTVPVPERTGTDGIWAPSRAWEAIAALGFAPVDYYETIRRVPGGFTVEVRPS